MATNLLLAPVVKIGISKLVDAATEQISLGWGWKKDLKKFRHQMLMLQDVLDDADEKHAAGRRGLKTWFELLRDVVEEADEVFQKVAYETTRHQVAALYKPRWKEVSYNFTRSSSNPMVFRMKMANKVKSLTKKLADINKSAGDLGLQYRLATNVPEPRVFRQTHSHPDSYVVGREKDVSAIVSMLTDSSNEHDKLSIISVVGMGGLGKTTLAQKVCVSEKTCSHFGKIIWVCVSENFEVQRILGEMLESLGEKGEIKNRDTLVQEIGGKLGGRRYLLVLDDVWSEDRGKWEELRDCLLGISSAESWNRVLVTTRNRKVAEIMGGTRPDLLYSLKGLEDEKCWSIVKERAFGQDNSIDSNLEKVGLNIARKCRGVPLVANVIGGMLCNKSSIREWEFIQNKVDAVGSLEEDGDKRIMGVLELSFNRLPVPALKQCFAFCSFFPKDSVMEKDLLVQLWMAEGFLRPSGDSTMEEIGDKYFKDLIAYSLFQKEEEKDSSGRVLACKMHDLVHDLASSITKGETVIYGGGFQDRVSEQVKHLNLIGGVPTNLENVVEKLRTLFLKRYSSSKLSAKLSKLRVVSFPNSTTKELTLCLSKMKNLTFLDVSATRIKELPEFISKLYNLQTFRYMYCEKLRGPPKGIENLLNLRHIYFNHARHMPANLGRLSNLQTLPFFVVGKESGFKIEELGGLKQLKGRLEIRNLGQVRDKSEAEGARLQDKKDIEELELRFKFKSEESDRNDYDVLEGLRPPSTLKILRIVGYRGSNLPPWVSELGKLVELKIMYCKKLIGIPRMEEFSTLQRVVIKNCYELSRIDEGFWSNTLLLEELEIDECPKLENVSVDRMSLLQKLSIKMCSDLGSTGEILSLPESLKTLDLLSCYSLRCFSSLNGLKSLKTLRIQYCDQLTSGLTSCTALESLKIESCEKLSCIPSLDGCTSLKRVLISSCDQLECLPSGLTSCTSLESLEIRCCEKLSCIPSLDGCTSLKRVLISSCDQLECLPSGLTSCTSLESLEIRCCEKLSCIPSLDGCTSLKRVLISSCDFISSCDQLECLPSGLSSWTALERLEIWCCKNLSCIPSLDGLTSLKRVCIEGSDQLECLPTGLSSCSALEEVEIRDCKNLVFCPKELPSLAHLAIVRCPKLRANPTSPEGEESLTSFDHLKRLEISAEGAEAFFSSIQYLPSIEKLELCTRLNMTHDALPPLPQWGTALKELTIRGFQVESSQQHCLGKLVSLTKLQIVDCNLISIPEGWKELPSLVELDIVYCKKLRSFPAGERGFSCLTSLRRLTLGPFSPYLEEFPDLSSFPPTPNLEHLCLHGWDKLTQLPRYHQIQHLLEGASSLNELTIEDFHSVETFPEWLGNLSSLQSLKIARCKNLQHLPSAEAIQRLSKLHRLYTYGCPMLKESCAKGSGSEWSKISHIPYIAIKADWI